jgi:hypothetical protein
VFKLLIKSLAVLVLQGTLVQTQSIVRPSALTNSTVLKGRVSDSALGVLISIGWQNKMPLGIVIEGDALCTHQITDSNSELTVAELIRQIEVLVPGYTGQIRDGVLFVHPKAMALSTLSALNLVVPRFTSPRASVQEVGVSLWMYIRALLVPQEGSAFVGGSQRNAEPLPSFEVSNATVQNILDLIISKQTGGLWTMRDVPVNWTASPKTIPYEILSYSGNLDLVKGNTCSQ